MKKLFLLLLFVHTLFVARIEAQWVQQNSGTTATLYDIYFPTPTAGYAVGYAGTLLKTSDAGESWNALAINTSEDLYAVHFTSQTTGFVAGDEHLFKTTDGGANWSEVVLSSGSQFRDLYFLDAQTGYCIGGENLILKTTDGGDTWTPTVTPVVSQYILSSIHFPTPQIGYVVGTGYSWSYLKTTDGGDTWSLMPINTPVANLSNLEAVYFTEPDKGFIGGWYISAFIATNNGGTNWTSLDDMGEYQTYSIHFPSALRGYTVGWHGQISSTTDGGASWNLYMQGNAVHYAVFFTDENTGYIAGSGGTILKTTNGGGIATSQEEVEAPAVSINIYPNPTTGELNLDLSSYVNRAVRLELYDAQGKAVKVIEIEAVEANAERLDLSQYQSGLYLIRVQSEGLHDVTKRVVLHGTR